MNRRMRRRMVTRGDVSLDVEDNRGPEEWPHTSDITVDMLKYSFHFPLEPNRMTWPGGESHASDNTGSAARRAQAGAMRVLNIVTPECLLLSSRERCPYMVHLEVAETGMEGSDARLYASGARGLGTTIGESLAMPSASNDLDDEEDESTAFDQSFPTYKIPSELLASSPIAALGSEDTVREARDMDDEFRNLQDAQEGDVKFPSRGGSWQAGEYYPPENFDATPYDMVRQQQYEQLHQQLTTQPPPPMPPSMVDESLPTLTITAALLDRVFGLPWDVKCEQIRQASPYGKVKGWRLASFIMKAGEDIRREALVMQVIAKLHDWFQTDIPESHRPKMRPYTIMCVGGDAGLLECLSDAKSVDEIKKTTDGFTTLRDYFERAYGPPQSRGAPNQYSPYESMPQGNHATGDGFGITFEMAQDNFLRSLVGYSLVCYILQIKDRHNANILMDREGHIMHIDFGFVLGDTPKMGKVPIFSERAPFKLSAEFWEVLGGWNYNNGGLGVKFCKMFESAFACASSHSDEIVSLVEAALMNLTRNPETARTLANGIRHRLRMRGPPGSVEQKTFVMGMVNTALASWGTTTYDWLQKNMNGYQ
jgi:phosphatidylinositol 4-kinase